MKCQLFDLFAKCHCVKGVICPFCIHLALIAAAIVFGSVLAWKPKKVIETQMALYRPFNWKLEPISMKKEIRNTRFMGLAVVIVAVASLLYVLFCK